MTSPLKIVAAVALALLTGHLASGFAGDWKETYKAGFPAANAHLRTAASYLRTGNLDLAALEIEGFSEAWNKLGAKLPKSDRAITQTLDSVAKAATAALAAIDSGDPDTARTGLRATRDTLWQLHKARGIALFADCIWARQQIGAALLGLPAQKA